MCGYDFREGQRAGSLGDRQLRRALQSPGFWRIVVAAVNGLAVQRSLRPLACKVDTGLPTLLGFGLGSPTLLFLRILPELINRLHFTPPYVYAPSCFHAS